MTNQIQTAPSAPAVFNFKESIQLRVVSIKGEPWFVATDVCAALDIGNVTQALSRLDDDEMQVIDFATLISNEGVINQQLNQNQKINIINESGLYSLILGSRKTEAKPFKKWVTSEVLPTIRKTGKYEMPTPSLPLKKTKIAVEGGLSLETQDELKNMINDLASTLPKDKQASAVIGMWSALGTHFEAKALKGNSKLAAYKFIPEAARLECVSLLARLPFNDVVTLSNTDMTALIDSKVQERIQGLPAPDLSLDTINDLIDVKIKAIQGELMPKANAMNDDQLIVSKSVLKKALRKVCGSTFTIHRHDEITVKVSETAYQQSEMAFFESLTA